MNGGGSETYPKLFRVFGNRRIENLAVPRFESHLPALSTINVAHNTYKFTTTRPYVTRAGQLVRIIWAYF